MPRMQTPFPHAAFSFGLDRPTTGRVFYVNSAATNASNGNKGDSPDRPLATLTGFLDHADLTANNGDTCYVMPNHAETITGVGGLTFDVAGIRVVGLGHGDQRPRFLMDGGTTVTALITAADVWLENLVFAGGHNGIATCFGITAANATLNRIEFDDNAADEHFLALISATGAAESASGLTVTNCRYHSIDAGITDFLSITDDITDLTFNDNYLCADAATGAGMILCATGKDILGLTCMRNILICGNTAGDLLIDNDTAVNTGIAAYNLGGSHDAAAMILIDCDGIRQFENYHTDADTTSGALIPAASSIT